GHAAAGAMGQSYHAVHARIARQHAAAFDGRHYVPGDGGRTVDRRQDADVVARAGPPIGAPVAHEAGPFGGCDPHGLAQVFAHSVVPLEIVQGDVVRMHVLARLDVGCRKADDLTVLADRLAARDGLYGDFVARRHGRIGPDAVVLQPGALLQ